MVGSDFWAEALEKPCLSMRSQHIRKTGLSCCKITTFVAHLQDIMIATLFVIPKIKSMLLSMLSEIIL